MNLKAVLLGALSISLAAARPSPVKPSAAAHKIVSKYGWFGSVATQVKAAVEASIDLTQPFNEFKIPSTLYEKVGPYTFAFDATNRRLFFSVPDSPNYPLGYNCLIGFDLSKPAGAAGSYQEMYLYGFGPGNVSFAAVPEGNDTRLWFDVDPDTFEPFTGNQLTRGESDAGRERSTVAIWGVLSIQTLQANSGRGGGPPGIPRGRRFRSCRMQRLSGM